MSLRFRRSIRLFPGVRLNFSRSGISTTVGVRGASMTLGPRGTYANVGLPGSGLSYRTKVSSSRTRATPQSPRLALQSRQFAPEPYIAPGSPDAPEPRLADGAVEIKSAEVSELTSPGLDELKRLINEASEKRRELTAKVEVEQEKLDRAKWRLRFAQSFIVRLFTRKSIPRLIEAVDEGREQLEDTTAQRDGCYIKVDFGFDDPTHRSYAALIDAFDGLTACQRIWSMTTYQAVDRVKARTIATAAFSRAPVRFDFATPEIVKLSQRAMRLNNSSGKHLYLYPGFLMMRDKGSDFALIEYSELNAELAEIRFVEEETVPSDAEIAGHTWKKANKDGSRDLRFNDNYQIPLVRYADLELKTATGLHEEFQFSDCGKGRAFFKALTDHERALAALARSDHPPPIPAAVADDEVGAEAEGEARRVPAVPTDPYVLDCVALGLAVIAVLTGGGWTFQHRADINRLLHPATVEAQPAPPPPVVAAPAHKPAHRHHKKVHRDPTAPAAAGDHSNPAGG